MNEWFLNITKEVLNEEQNKNIKEFKTNDMDKFIDKFTELQKDFKILNKYTPYQEIEYVQLSTGNIQKIKIEEYIIFYTNK